MDYSNPKLNEKRTKAYYNSTAKKSKNKVMVIIIRAILICALVAVFAVVSVLLGAYMNIIERAPKLEEIFTSMMSDDNYTTRIVNPDTNEEIDRLDGGESREYVSSGDIPVSMKLAMVAIEDERFYEHDGVDLRGLIRSVVVTLTTSRTEGASTITQQVIKNKLGYTYNVFETKFQEQVLAINFEKVLTEQLGSKERAKDYILTVYLNSISLGHGTIGVQAAALYYFNKNVWELSLSECATIAAITSNPSARSPLRHPEHNNQRRMAVLDKMLELGFIAANEYREAADDDVYSRISEIGRQASEQPSYHSYFVDEVIKSVIADLMEKYNLTSSEASDWVYRRGLTIYPTMDADIQAVVDQAFTNEDMFPKTEFEIEITYSVNILNTNTGLTRTYKNSNNKGIVKSWDEVDAYVEGLKDKILKEGDVIVAGTEQIFKIVQPQASMTIIDYHTGYVLAMAGGRGEKTTNRGFNRATDATRSPGSTFKVVASYAPAMDLGLITAATVYDDAPHYDEKGELWPKNWYTGGYRGLRSVRLGIVDSMNILAVRNLEKVGISNAFNYLLNFGFTSLVNEDRVYSLALGGLTKGVSPLELTAAYGTIANGGVYVEPIVYTKVLDHNGNILLENVPDTRQVLQSTTAYILTNIMQDVMKTGTGTRAAFSKAVTIPTAGKTGTTSDTKDLWFAGYTPYYACSVWVGYDTPKKLNSRTTGDSVHQKLWSYVMEEIHKNLPYKDFTVPEGIVQVTVCTQSGKLPVPGLCDNDYRGNLQRTEYFKLGTEPTETCDVHQYTQICVAENKLPTTYCPSDYIATVVRIVRPEPYYGEAPLADQQYEVPREYCAVHNPYYTVPTETWSGQEDANQPAGDNQSQFPVIYIPENGETPVETQDPWQNIFTPMPTVTPSGAGYGH